MDIIEKAIHRIKKNYSPPIVTGNEQSIKDDLIACFSCILEDIHEALHSGLSDKDTLKKIKTLLWIYT